MWPVHMNDVRKANSASNYAENTQAVQPRQKLNRYKRHLPALEAARVENIHFLE